ncbi:DNA polymerase III subunit alpha [uncultured Phascolarctobacterium sp.]|jgi:DNA polymerase-3 subunit alpha|uniref:DNA polymerase III subunit alpha n=1 Tax=uncultured Phascolarctobacterium sp. TaxID=512296 RepID=UPI0025EB0A83|nr:DNA polymerase III subunit alpha [uncultured Phascolarctobacterium sp.]
MQRFTHLHVHTEYSLLDGASKIPELVAYAKELGMDSLAITDHGVMYGAVEFYQECTKAGIKPIIGCEVYLAKGSHLDMTEKTRYHLILLAENDIGYHNLMRIVSKGQLEGFYYKPRVDKDILRTYSEGIICLSACIAGEVPRLINSGNMDGARRCVQEYIDIFGKDNYFLEIQNHDIPEEKTAAEGLRQLAQEFGIGLVATNDLHYVRREDAEAQDVLLCIQTTSNVDDPGRMRFPNDSFYLKSAEEMAELFGGYPEALENTCRIADRCNVKLEFGHLLLPEFPVPEGFDAVSYLRHLCEEALPERYEVVDETVRKRLDFELDIINTMGYACYFLIVWDFINYCRSHDIPVGPGRGSAAGSIVAYLLRITNIEPLRYHLLFERFLNPERVSMPDIDTDFCYVKRNQVLDYVVRRYGQERVSQIITFGTLQARAAVRDVGKALGMSYSSVDEVAKMIPRELGITLDKALKSSNDFKRAYESRPEVKKLVDLARSVEGLPRNAGTHAAGVIIAPRDLRDYVPLQQGSDSGVITQYDKNKVEELGLLKMDFLGLRTLTVIGDCIQFIKETTGETVDIDNIPLHDKETCEMLCRGETACVFQLESAGITKLVMDLAPESFEDLIPLVALYRPGPLGTGMAEDFIAGRHGQRTAEVLHPLMEPILEDTYGVILYQEQVMQITSALAGFTLGQADILRRAMGKKKAKELDSMRASFIEGAKRLHDIPEELSDRIFSLLQHFAGYGFNKSHSVAYALVAYETAYLKAHWRAQYYAAFLNSVIGDGDKLSWYISVCKNDNIKILAPDVNESGRDFTVLPNKTIRFGLAGIKSTGGAAVEAIISARSEGGPFTSLTDFCCRVNMRVVNKRVVENLIKCGAMDSFGALRSQLLAVLDQVIDLGAACQRDRANGQLGLFGDDQTFGMEEIRLPQRTEIPKQTLLQYEKELLGFYVTDHPLSEYKEVMQRFMPLHQFIGETQVQDNQFVRVAGIISSCNIKTTKSGDTMALLTLEDFTGRFPVIIFPKNYQACIRDVFEDNVVSIEGRFSVDERESKIIAMSVHSLSSKPPTELMLRIEAHLENPLVQRELMQLFQKYKGEDVVYLKLMGSRKIIKTTADFWVNSEAPGFAEDIVKILGEGCVTRKNS